jgi:hypothetical protein
MLHLLLWLVPVPLHWHVIFVLPKCATCFMLPIILRTLLYHAVIFGPMGEEVTGAGESSVLWTFTSCQLPTFAGLHDANYDRNVS